MSNVYIYVHAWDWSTVRVLLHASVDNQYTVRYKATIQCLTMLGN